MATFRELFTEDQRDLLADIVEFYRKHCAKHGNKQPQGYGTVSELDKINQWKLKELDIRKIQNILVEESF